MMSRKILVILLCVTAISGSCEKPAREGPFAAFTIQPEFGDSLTVFHFDASPSSDNQTDNFRLKARWDIYADGSWENDFTIKKDFAYRFPRNGTYLVICEIMDSHGNIADIAKAVQVQPVPRDSLFTDARDGNVYRAVFLFDRWWMAENLDYGISMMPGEAESDNSLTEKYKCPDSVCGSSYGGYYSWNEASNYGRAPEAGICPDGWRLPRGEDLNRISEILWFTTDFSPYLSEGGYYRLDLILSGKYIITAKTWDSQGRGGNFWVNEKQPFEKFVAWARYSPRPPQPFRPEIITDYNPLVAEIVWNDLWGFFSYQKVALPVRCIKDHEIN